ncbi:hypothetical protein K432DRAFT_439378 [Lepidopterella palustris CBS 459.81]|uniref:Uncharacterized protein n=1 Tax=Lepidopterella palustris CBS 459.81 TaxID=1314670 RepID=A0A8E2JK07_9PEZI|nr:hypothetical protein K432DRAFT_439378 [Lepidopterella palustris CBS 459.81]
MLGFTAPPTMAAIQSLVSIPMHSRVLTNEYRRIRATPETMVRGAVSLTEFVEFEERLLRLHEKFMRVSGNLLKLLPNGENRGEGLAWDSDEEDLSNIVHHNETLNGNKVANGPQERSVEQAGFPQGRIAQDGARTTTPRRSSSGAATYSTIPNCRKCRRLRVKEGREKDPNALKRHRPA